VSLTPLGAGGELVRRAAGETGWFSCPAVDRTAELQVPQQETSILIEERFEVDEGHDVLEVAERLVAIALRVEGSDGVFHSIFEQFSPAHHAKASLAFVVRGEQRSFRGKEMPDMNAIPFIREWRLVTAESELKPRVIVEVDVGVEQIDAVVCFLE